VVAQKEEQKVKSELGAEEEDEYLKRLQERAERLMKEAEEIS